MTLLSTECSKPGVVMAAVGGWLARVVCSALLRVSTEPIWTLVLLDPLFYSIRHPLIIAPIAARPQALNRLRIGEGNLVLVTDRLRPD